MHGSLERLSEHGFERRFCVGVSEKRDVLTPGEAEIRQLAVKPELLRPEHQDVAGFDVSVHDAHAVEVLGCFD